MTRGSKPCKTGAGVVCSFTGTMQQIRRRYADAVSTEHLPGPVKKYTKEEIEKLEQTKLLERTKK